MAPKKSLMLKILFPVITKKTPMQYTAIFHSCKNGNFKLKSFDYFLIFAQSIYCGYTLEPPLNEAVLTDTHNICFRAKIRK